MRALASLTSQGNGDSSTQLVYLENTVPNLRNYQATVNCGALGSPNQNTLGLMLLAIMLQSVSNSKLCLSAAPML